MIDLKQQEVIGSEGIAELDVQSDSGLERLPFTEFVWGAGIECSFIPHLNVDQFQWTQHDRFWKEDFKRAADDLHIKYLRYAFPWHVLESEPGKFDFSYSDQRLEEMEKLGIEPLLDVMHFGTPTWLSQSVGDPEFPEALERFTQALVERYRGKVRTWCPMNEPLVQALFSGDFGFWPPHARKWRGYMPVLSRVIQGVSRSIRAIRRAMPEATVLLCDAAEHFKTREPSLEAEVALRNERRFLAMDLLLGRVNHQHPLYSWLTSYGFGEQDLDWLNRHPQGPDVLGLDYYPHSDWQLEASASGPRQRRADTPLGFAGVANQYYQRYGIPLMLTETSIEGAVMNREMWLDQMLNWVSQLRGEGVPMLGFFWWPLIDQVDWDGALTHHIGKIHNVGLYKLIRQADGTLSRQATPMVRMFREVVAGGTERVGELTHLVQPATLDLQEDQGPVLGVALADAMARSGQSAGDSQSIAAAPAGGGNGQTGTTKVAAAASAAPARRSGWESQDKSAKSTGRYGILVFSHLRWGFVWQRPQQFLSRFAKKHTILFVEEPMFDLGEGAEPSLSLHRVMPNVVVACPHVSPSWNSNPQMPELLRKFTRQAMETQNDDGEFDAPLIWYYSPMDAAWSLGHFANRGVVYDSMDELSQFTGAPKTLVANEARLMEYSDVVFAGGYELYLKKKDRHPNVHFFGCGVEYEHFALAQDPVTAVPPDIDFMGRPILGWFGVIDERVDYGLIGEVARKRPDWSIAMVGPVVKVDPNLLPHFPNLFYLGQRDYQVLPNYCKAFDICIMPFANNASTQYINPTKALEYMATGKPIISTPVKDVVRQYADLLTITSNNSPEEFVKAAEQIFQNSNPGRIAAGIEKARQNSWENTVATMQNLISQAIGKEERPSKKKVRPLAEAEGGGLEYVYMATQGS